MTPGARQLELFNRSPQDDLVFTNAASSRSRMAKYVHVIRYGSDPLGSPRGKPGTFYARHLNDQTPEEWAQRIVEHLSDGGARTFHRLMVELADVTADAAHGSHADSGLWLAVERQQLEHTLSTPVFFRVARRDATVEAP
jgi:hypothetical protein